MSALAPLLNPFGWIPENLFHRFIRKLAHFVEFGALGVCMSGVSLNMKWQGKKRWVAPALGSLIAAIIDETIQRFTGRASMVKDGLIDFSGAVCGVLFVAMLLWLWHYHKRKQGTESDANPVFLSSKE